MRRAPPGMPSRRPSVRPPSPGLFVALDAGPGRALLCQQVLGLDVGRGEDDLDRSARGVLRGLHYQLQQPQGKLVRVASGAVFDVAVDIRRSSPTFGKVACVELSDANQRMFWLPPGLAHGFLVVSESADFLYKTTDYYAPEHERCILWNDPELAIPWPLTSAPALSAKDVNGVPFAVAELFP